MVYEHAGDLAIGPHPFRASALVPEASMIRTSVPGTFNRFTALHCHRDGRYSGLAVTVAPGSWLRVFIFCGPEGSDYGGLSGTGDRSQSIAEEFYRIAASLSGSLPENCMDEFQRFAFGSDQILSAAMLFLEVSGQEELSETFAAASVLMAGMPPAVLIENGHFCFPVRSGLPLGVVDLSVKPEILELPLQSVLFLHSPLSRGGSVLRRFHMDLARSHLENLPGDILLFRLGHGLPGELLDCIDGGRELPS